ncbi:type I polyketide synthase [Chloroflexia bacterium SDU3-3]|nr:type I polyketide synthase [Chloroflexia bacterium SDU3-3]
MPLRREPIAIIGIGCRLPGGVVGPLSFWDLLASGQDATSDVPADRWDIRSFYDPDPAKPGKLKTFHGGFLDQVDRFDAPFFGISPREADCLDPQQRLLLEVSWEALEDAGLAPERLAGSNTGVFVGAFTLDYKVIQFSAGSRDLIDSHTATGSMMTMVSNRLSYAYDLRGPSMSVDTACSSSMVAVHLACQSLWRGECSLALAGGVNVMTTPEYTIAESKGGFLSPDGRCKTFDSRANGYARGEGAGVLVLKPLAQALADGDPIYALIRGTAVNQDGHTQGITVPNGDAQQALLREACRQAGVAPWQLQYVEAHGTGTPVGDPIEANALGTALAEDRPEGECCVIGSVKTNIGHLEAAAGVAGLIKAALALHHRAIPPHLHLISPNPAIAFDALRLRVPQALEPWPAHSGPALAGVNSFGFGGTNGHAVLEEAPEGAVRHAFATGAGQQRPHLLALSARGQDALEATALAYADMLEQQPEAALDAVCATTALRRGQHDHRVTAVGHSPAELAEHLRAFAAGESRPGLTAGRALAGRRPRLAFVFSGMGPQWWAMGRQLLAQEPVFRAAVERCDALLSQHADWSLLAELAADESASRMNETQIAQPANFALQVGLFELWRSWGVEPDAIVGHSAGEAAAFYAAGVMSLEEAVRVIYHRSRLQHRTTGQGKMVAVGISHQEALELLKGYENRISIAAVNSPSAVTLVGDTATLEEFIAPLQARQVFCRYLRVEVPYHSHYMEVIREDLLAALGDIALSQARVPLYSTATGQRADGRELNAEYWWHNVRESVRFAAAADVLIGEGYDLFLELSPHPVLAGSIMECLAHRQATGSVLPSIRRNEEEQAVMLGSLGALYTLGLPVAWDALYPGAAYTTLPAYAWQRERYWNESEAAAQIRLGYQDHPLLGRPLALPTPTWEQEINRRALAYLDDHCIQGAVLYPGAGYVEMGLAAGRLAFGASDLAVEDVAFRKALFLPDGATPQVQVQLDAATARFSVFSRQQPAQGWTLHAEGRLRQRQELPSAALALDGIRARCAEALAGEACYAQFAAQGFTYGPKFQGIARLWRGQGEALAEICPTVDADALGGYHLHPVILDACFQVLIAVNPDAGADRSGVYLPVGIDRIRVARPAEGELWGYARVVERTPQLLRGDIVLVDAAGELIAEISGFRAQALDRAQGGMAADALERTFYEPVWLPQERGQAAAAQAGAWLVLANRPEAEALAAELAERGQRCVLVADGAAYQEIEPGARYVLNPSEKAEFSRLLGDLRAAGLPLLGGVAHMWALADQQGEELAPAELDAAQRRGSLALLLLTQALIEAGVAPKIWVVTRGAQAVRGEPQLAVAQAPLWGIGRVIGYQELVGFWGGAVDLDPATPAGEAAALADELLTPAGEDQIAFRAGQRYVARLEHSAALTPALPAHFRPDASYLITGAFGALGQLVARWMVERGARRLILAGRSALPPRAEWADLAPSSPAAERVALIRSLEAGGASVHLAQVDVADEAELAGYLAQFRREGWPAVRGVIHSAGIVRDQILMQMDAASFTDVLRPKVLGGWALHRCLRDTPLDFFVLFSSVASQVVSTGQANYAAGNAFLDSLAQHRRAQGLPALSINWGPWAVGMVRDLNLIEHYERRGMAPIAPEDGMSALGRLLGQPVAQASVLMATWPTVLEYYPQHPPLFAHLAQQANAEADDAGEQSLAQRIAQAEGPERLALVEEQLRDLAARVLRLDRAKLDVQQPLSALGMNSMMAIELKNRIDLTLNVTVAVVELLQGFGVAQLAARLLPQIEAQVALASAGALSEEAAQQIAEQVDGATLDELLSELENLSDEEAELLLAGREGA